MPKVTYWILVGAFIFYNFFVFFPDFLLPSIIVTWFAIFVAIVGLVFGVLANYFQSRLFRMIGNISMSILWFTWSLRAWMYLYDWSWYVAILLFAGLILTGLVPFINYHFADALYREGFAPKTRLGKAIQRISLALMPSVGVLGALFGLNSKTPPAENMPILWIFAIAFYVVPASIIFNATTEYASKRPYLFSPWTLWRKKEKRTRRGKND
jgi:MFS family permease